MILPDNPIFLRSIMGSTIFIIISLSLPLRLLLKFVQYSKMLGMKEASIKCAWNGTRFESPKIKNIYTKEDFFLNTLHIEVTSIDFL